MRVLDGIVHRSMDHADCAVRFAVGYGTSA